MKNMLRLTCALMLVFCWFRLLRLLTPRATQDQPTIAKDSIQIRAFTFNVL